MNCSPCITPLSLSCLSHMLMSRDDKFMKCPFHILGARTPFLPVCEAVYFKEYFWKNIKVGNIVELESLIRCQRQKGRKRWKRRIWLCNQPFSKNCVKKNYRPQGPSQLLNEKSHRGQTHLKMTTRARAIHLKHQKQHLLCKRRIKATCAAAFEINFQKSDFPALIGM